MSSKKPSTNRGRMFVTKTSIIDPTNYGMHRLLTSLHRMDLIEEQSIHVGSTFYRWRELDDWVRLLSSVGPYLKEVKKSRKPKRVNRGKNHK